ncbi:hypothetical protein Tery_3644 [Trichodesmium erythraeum IMS101]|uniref:Uncharacterized protein n=2 Tax=Trichodesmium erythraeum TaxID=1206 RepID=Q10YG5_TRIEI
MLVLFVESINKTNIPKKRLSLSYLRKLNGLLRSRFQTSMNRERGKYRGNSPTSRGYDSKFWRKDSRAYPNKDSFTPNKVVFGPNAPCFLGEFAIATRPDTYLMS